MVSLWGKSVTLVYEPSTASDAQTISSYGGIEQTPAYVVHLTAKLKVDGQLVATGIAESPGLNQTARITTTSPASGPQVVEHTLQVGGVYAFALDPGLVPDDLISEHEARYPSLYGDDLDAE